MTIYGVETNMTMQEVVLPKCARTVTYTVAGASAGSGGGMTGQGSEASGVFAVSGGETLTLVAGGQGHPWGTAPVRSTGYGSGGGGSPSWFNGAFITYGSGGGAGSAIMLGPGWTGKENPLIVAGGGGGTYDGVAGMSTWGVVTATNDYGGNAAKTGEDGSIGASPWYSGGPGQPANQHIVGGAGGTATGPGYQGYLEAGGTLAWQPGSPGSGHDGGETPWVDPNQPGYRNSPYGFAGGGGGGWFGGGSGGKAWLPDVYTTNASTPRTQGWGMGSGGGAGSNHYAGATSNWPATVGSVTVPYPSQIRLSKVFVRERPVDWQQPGMVTITWS